MSTHGTRSRYVAGCRCYECKNAQSLYDRERAAKAEGRAVAPPRVFRPPAVAQESWMNDASCKGTDPEWFFPKRGEPTEEAKAVCSDCPVRVECLEYALSHREKYGVWAGTSERQRRLARSNSRFRAVLKLRVQRGAVEEGISA